MVDFFCWKTCGTLGWVSKPWNFQLFFFVDHPYSGLNTTHKIYRLWQSPSGLRNISQNHSMFWARRWKCEVFLWHLCPLESIHTKEVSKNPLEYHYTTWPLLSCQQHWHWKILEHEPSHVPKNKIPSKKTLSIIGNEHKWATNDHHSQRKYIIPISSMHQYISYVHTSSHNILTFHQNQNIKTNI